MKTPVEWLNIWEGPESPNNWLKSFFKKLMSLKSWADIAKSGASFSNKKLDLNDLFNPETFLNAQKQATSRKIKTPLDELKLVVAFNQNEIDSNFSLNLNELLLQGCSFENGRLVDSNSDENKEFTNLPPIYIAYIPKNAKEPYADMPKLDVPVYDTFIREKLICCLGLPYQGDKNKLIIKGTAIALI